MDCLPMHESVTSYVYYLENNASFADFYYAEINYAIVDLQNCMLISPVSSEKSLSIGWLSNSQWEIQVFQNSNFTWKFKLLLLAINTVSCVPLSDRHTYFIFEKCLPNSKSDHQSLLVVLPSKTWWYSLETVTKSAYKCKHCHKCFLQDRCHTLLCRREVLYAYVPSSHAK